MNRAAIPSLRSRQESWLLTCLQRNAECDFGQRHGFASIRTVAQYREHVPLHSYEAVLPSITRMAAGDDDVLFAGKPAAFEQTGGSTGGRKLIPYTEESFQDFRRAVEPWLSDVFTQYDIGAGQSYFSISPALRPAGLTKRGMPIGVDDAAYLGEKSGMALASTMAVPSWVSELQTFDDWQTATLYWLVVSDRLALISVWSPTFLLLLLNALDTRYDVLRQLFQHGGTVASHALPPDRAALERLTAYARDRDTVRLWPELRLISCWEDASSKPFAEALKVRFPQAAFQPKGLISTESAVTVPDPDGEPLLCAQSGFFEFIGSDGRVLLADELSERETYEVVLTTNGGLYRYRSGDLVRFEGFKHALPVLRFVGRNGAVSDIVGEKLTETFVQHALEGLEGFAMLVPRPSATPSYLLVGEDEHIAAYCGTVETRLLQNPQYAYARKIGQLGALEPIVLKDAMTRYIVYKTASGSRIGDVKIPALQTEENWYKIVEGLHR